MTERSFISTMCGSCGDNQLTADPPIDNLFEPHVNRRTGEPCAGEPHPQKWIAPFTSAQILALNRYQLSNRFHPYTCGACSDHPNLVAIRSGWHCLVCEYSQDWAHAIPEEEKP